MPNEPDREYFWMRNGQKLEEWDASVDEELDRTRAEQRAKLEAAGRLDLLPEETPSTRAIQHMFNGRPTEHGAVEAVDFVNCRVMAHGGQWFDPVDLMRDR
jgi:hypothetical protein